MVRGCSVCALAATDPDRLAAIHASLVALPSRAAAARHGLARSVAHRHLAHVPGLREQREAVIAARAPKDPPPNKEQRRVRAIDQKKIQDIARGKDPSVRDRGSPDAPPRRPLKPTKPRAKKVVRPPGKLRGRGAIVSRVAREVYALQLRQKGLSYIEIAEQMGLRLSSGAPDAKMAYLLAMDAFERFNLIGAETAAEARALECARYDAMTKALWSRATEARVIIDEKGAAVAVDAEAQDRAIHLLLAVSKERKKILGLDVPRAVTGLHFGVNVAGGPNRLPPALAILDPAPTDEELEHYAETGELPERAQQSGAPRVDGLREIRDEMGKERPPRRSRGAGPNGAAEDTAGVVEAPPEGDTPVPTDASGEPAATAPEPAPDAGTGAQAPEQGEGGAEPPASQRAPRGAGEGWWKRVGGS